MKFNLTYQQLKESERSVYSQGMQDGILEAIFKQLEIEKGYYIEYGAGNGIHISNTAWLQSEYGWTGLLMDAEAFKNMGMMPMRWVEEETITAENINSLYEKYKVPDEVDYQSIDMDGIDFFVWQAIKIKPKVVSIEYNSKFRNDESFTIEYNSNHKWEGDDYYGASLLALKKLGEQKGYTLVYVVAQYDAIFIRNDLIDNDYVPPTIEELLPEPIVAHDKKSSKKWVEIK